MQLIKRKSKKEKPIDPSRVATLWLHPNTILELFKNAQRVVIDNHLPEDAELRGVFWDPRRNVWGVTVASNTFDEVKLGHEPPVLPSMTIKAWEPSDGAGKSPDG